MRTVAEYSEGHIPGSININVLDEQFAAYADELLDKNEPVAVYCKSGRRSRNAARLLSQKGFKVYNLDKGFESWKENGKEIENNRISCFKNGDLLFYPKGLKKS